MLGREETLFQSVKSIEYVCYRESEATDDELRRLLRELPGAGVTLIELDAWDRCASDVGRVCAGSQNLVVEGQHRQISPRPETTLLLAGSAQTLALAKDTKVATVGYGQLVLAGYVDSVDTSASEEKNSGKAVGMGEIPDENRMVDTDRNVATDLQPDILVEGFDEVDVQFLDRIMKRAQGLPWITVVTERCYLREITLDDMDDLFALYAQPGITDYTEPLYERPAEEQYTRDYIDKMYRFYGYGMWLVCDRESGELIGRAGFSHQDLGEEIVLEMGYIIGVPYQRQGYATEVCQKLIEFARVNLSDFGSLNCFVEPENIASHGLMEKLRFERIGTVKIGEKMMVRYQTEL